MKIFLLFSIFFTLGAQAKEVELYADCPNYCAFREFEKNCHGIAFKAISDEGKKIKYHYTHWSDSRKGCVNNRIPFYDFISEEKVKNACPCVGLPEKSPPPDKDQDLSEKTRQELIALKKKILSWAPCAPDPLTIDYSNDQTPYGPKAVKSCDEMKKKGEPGYIVLGGCHTDGNHQCTYYGNTNNYAGPLCAAGDMDRCADVLKNQDPETGAWHRSAFQKRTILAERGQPMFSRDEFVGIMLYFIQTKDKVAAEKWMKFVAENPEIKSTLLGNLNKVISICPPLPDKKPDELTDFQWQEMQPDDRCEMRGDSWATMYKVYKYIGFSDDELKSISKKMYRKMRVNDPIGAIIANISTRTVKEVGYEQGNQATNVLILQLTGHGDNPIVKDAARVINDRSGYESAYYHYLDKRKPTEYGAYLIKKYCPENKPDYQNPPHGGQGIAAAGFFDFAVHYFNGVASGWEANMPTGHECLGWINFYLK